MPPAPPRAASLPLVAALLAQPSARRLALSWHRPIRLLAALALAFSAIAVLCPVLPG